jgi:hypothetical protein
VRLLPAPHPPSRHCVPGPHRTHLCAKKQSGRVHELPFLHICVLKRSGCSQYSWTECV